VLLLGGVVHTLDEGWAEAEAIGITGSQISYVGTTAGAWRMRGKTTQVVRLQGQSVLPGFHDSHVHPVTGGIEYLQCNLNQAESVEEVASVVAKCASAKKPPDWIVGGGWSMPLFPKEGPDARALDALVGDRPAFLTGADGHSAWVSSAAMQRAGITKETPDPEGGRIERRADGTPNGTLRESAVDLVASHLPPVTHCDHVRGLRFAMAMAHRLGITSLEDASASESVLAAYKHLADAGDLGLRVVAAQTVDVDKGAGDVPRLARLRKQYGGGTLRPTSAKIFLDGVIEGRTAALLRGYQDRPDYRGELLMSRLALTETVRALDDAGFDVHIHAIGDWGIRTALDALEAGLSRPDARPTIAHLQLISPKDIPRFKQLGVTANFQALWAWEDPYIKNLTVPFIGKERSRWLYPIASVAKTGARLVGGSDWSVSSMDPLQAISVAMRRLDPTVKTGTAFIPEERVSLREMLVAYTRAGAYLLRQEDTVGTLEVGKAADLVILDRNIFAHPEAVQEAEVLATFFSGALVYKREGLWWPMTAWRPGALRCP